MQTENNKLTEAKRPYLRPMLQTLGLVKEMTMAGGSKANESANDPTCQSTAFKGNPNCPGN